MNNENVENEHSFWYWLFSIFGASEDFEALFSLGLRVFFAWIWSSCCVYLMFNLLITNYVKCSLFGFLFVFKNLYCVATTDVSMGEIVKFVFGSSSIANLGLFGKLKVQFKYR